MAQIFYKPTRMCVSCRDKKAQEELLRLQCEDKELHLFRGYGRSFYICKDCQDNEQKVLKALMRQCRSGDKTKYITRLKEIITDDK